MGPIGFTAASIKAAISGIGAILKKPKILLTTLFILALQAALSYLKILMPSSFPGLPWQASLLLPKGVCMQDL
jgi:hypothetical protein